MIDLRNIKNQFVKPYVKSNKNDAADAEAIYEAVQWPNMRFVPVKNIIQQGSVQSLHRTTGSQVNGSRESNPGIVIGIWHRYPQGN